MTAAMIAAVVTVVFWSFYLPPAPPLPAPAHTNPLPLLCSHILALPPFQPGKGIGVGLGKQGEGGGNRKAEKMKIRQSPQLLGYH